VRAGLRDVDFPFLAGLSEPARRELSGLATTRVPSAARLLARGDVVEGAYLVVAGALRVYYVTDQGREATLYRVETGGTCVLALSSTFAEEPYPAWVESGKRGAAFVRVQRATFHRLLAAEPAFRDFVFGALSGRIFELMVSLEELGTARMERRVARLLVTLGGATGVALCTQSAIASELGTAREVVFRALRSLAERGLVRCARGRVYIDDRARLLAAVGVRPARVRPR
jgi:CRP/FNR family transcriptional regulator